MNTIKNTASSIDVIEDIPILYQDNDLLIVNKPSNLLSVPGRGEDKQDCLINRVIKVFPNARTVHRLDMATSGLVIVALSHTAQAAMGKLFEQRLIEKHYIAVVTGQIPHDSGRIDLPLICDWERRPIQKVDHEHGKPAQTDYTVINREPESNITRVKLTPLTGRSHQLRVHMLALGHPILGDYFYATETVFKQSTRLLLHASALHFEHPITGDSVVISSNPDF